MPLNVPVFYKRLASSVVFVAIMLTGLLWNEWSFLALVCLISFLCLREFMRLMQKVDKETYWPSWIPVTVLSASVLWLIIYFGLPKPGHYFWVALYYISLIFPALFAVVFMLFAVLSKHTAWSACMQSVFGIVYIILPMSLLMILYKTDNRLPLLMILLIWTNDTAAYLVGSFFGKTPFSPISPKKTWEGVIGATLLTIAMAVLAGPCLGVKDGVIRYGRTAFGVIGLVVSIAGPAGDLFKSKFKRLAGVKDSGNLMPGHGGALDRFDSLLMVVPFVYCLLYIMSLF